MLRRSTLLLIAVVILHLLVAGWFAWHRPIDGDEGYYGMAARLVADGAVPYTDFFYPQAPLLPWIYAPAAALMGAPQLPDLRAVSVLFSVLTVALAAVWLRRQHEPGHLVPVAALLLLALSPEFLLWNTTVKTYAWVNLAVMAGLVGFQRGLGGRTPWFLVGGCCLGLAVSARLLYAPAALAPAAWLVLVAGHRTWRGALSWLIGLAAGLAPVWISLARNPDVFWFNNVGYHQLRFSELEDASIPVRMAAAFKELAVTVTTDPGLLVLVVLAALGLAWSRRGPEPRALPAAAHLSLWMAVVLTVTSLLPDPVHRQYFTGGLPVLLLAPAAWALACWPGRHPRVGVIGAAVAAPVLAVIGLLMIRHDLPRETYWQLDHYRETSARIAELSDPGDTVFSFWSGYVAGSDRLPQRGMENHFAVGVSERLDHRRRARYHIAGRREIAEAFRLETPRVVVVGAWMNEVDTALDDGQMTDLLQHFARHYQGIEDRDGVKLALRLREIGQP